MVLDFVNYVFKKNDRVFLFLALASVLSVLFSHPFLKYPYDMWKHLITIDNIYGNFIIPNHRDLWYLFWANIFQFFSIENFFIRAKIIHIGQTITSLLAVFVFSRVLVRNLFTNVNKNILNYLAYWSVLIWVTIYATFSMYHHQVWMMWYSINYQISLPIFWYITALTLILVFEQKNYIVKCVYVIQIIFFCYVILSIHPMELVYYFVYLSFLVLIFANKLIQYIKTNAFIAFLMGIITTYLLYAGSNYYNSHKERIPKLVNLIETGQMYEAVMRNGLSLIHGLNRAYASINELMIVTLFLGIMLSADVFRRKLCHFSSKVNGKLFLFTIATSLLVTIPLFQLTSGFASIVFYEKVVHRVYYMSSLFILVPIGVFYFWTTYNVKWRVTTFKINFSIGFIVLVTLLYSFYFSTSHNYYKNIKSLVDSFDERKVGFNLSHANIQTIGLKLREYENSSKQNMKPFIYYARRDITFVLKYIYKREVYQTFLWNGRNYESTLDHFNAYSGKREVLQSKSPVVFETPSNFPDYVPYK